MAHAIIPRMEAPPETNSQAPASLGSHTARGAFWSLLFSLLNKATTFGSQLALAYFLAPKDFGVLALAGSLGTLLSFVSVGSLADSLVQEGDEARFRQGFSDLFWLTNTLNFGLALVTLAAAPFLARAYHEPRLAGLLAVLALNGVFSGLSLAHGAALKRSLRFKDMAVIFFAAGTLQSLLQVLMAWRGAGAYAIAVPLAASSLLGTLWQWRAAGDLPLGRPEPRRWGAHLRGSFWLLFLGTALALPGQATSFVMGFRQSAAQIGMYFWGFSMANQAVFLLGNNLRQVFFPAFARLNAEPERQGRALKESARVMTSLTAFLCAAQAAAAAPGIALVFPARWAGAAPVVEAVSLGLATQALTVLYFSIAMAQGRYRAVVLNAAIQAALVAAGACLGALPAGRGPLGAAVGTAAGLLAAGAYCGWDMLRPYGRALASLASLCAAPLACAAAAFFAGRWAAGLAGGPAARLALAAAGSTLAYALALAALDRDTLRQIRSRIPSHAP